MDKEGWAHRFVDELLRLGSDAEPDELFRMGLELQPLMIALMPEAAARQWVAEWGLPRAGSAPN